jgi:hypothetical protein
MQVIDALAPHVGRTLTAEAASAIVRQMAPVPALLPIMPTREQIENLERLMLQQEQADTPTTHYFAPGLYCREQFIPAGTVLTGAVHKTEHIAIFHGDITVWTERGMKRLTGRHTLVSKPGAKRVGFAHADTWCTNVFGTDKTTLAEVEPDICEEPQRLLTNRGLITSIQPQLIEEG